MGHVKSAGQIGRALGEGLTNMATHSARAAATANAVSAQAQAAQGAFNQESANQANMINENAIANQYAYNSANMASANEYNTAMWERAAEWNEMMWQKQADFNSAEAQKNRDWQTQMSNTQYQRAMKDMAAAGLNPILAYNQGGAGVPGGATASVGGAQMSSASAQMASGGLLDAHQASENNYTGQMEYMSTTLAMIAAITDGLSSAFKGFGSLGDLGEALGQGIAHMFDAFFQDQEENKEQNAGKPEKKKDTVKATSGGDYIKGIISGTQSDYNSGKKHTGSGRGF